MNIDIITMGHIMKEMILFPNYTVGPILGGASAYSSVVASILGLKVGIVSKIGKDMPLELLEPLYKSGVYIEGLKIEGKHSRISHLIYHNNGTKTMKYIKKGRPIVFSDIPDYFINAKIIYICPQEKEISLKTIKKIFSKNKKIGAELGGFGGAHWSHHSKRDLNYIKKFLPYFNIVKLSKEDSMFLFKELNEEKIVKTILSYGVEICILTLAEKGAIIAKDSEIFIIPSLTKNPVDFTGAGDCFAASFFVNFLQKKDIKKAGLFASATTSLMIEHKGGLKINRIPTLEQVEKRLKDYHKGE